MKMMLCPTCWNNKRRCEKCGTTGYIEDVKLTESFYLGEMLYSPKAIALGIVNACTPAQVSRLRSLCEDILQPARDALGSMKVNSGFRSLALNGILPGASKTSAHLAAWAADIKPLGCSLEDMMHWFKETKLPFDQVILEPSWVHVGLKNPATGKQRHQILVKEGANYPHWEDT